MLQKFVKVGAEFWNVLHNSGSTFHPIILQISSATYYNGIVSRQQLMVDKTISGRPGTFAAGIE